MRGNRSTSTTSARGVNLERPDEPTKFKGKRIRSKTSWRTIAVVLVILFLVALCPFFLAGALPILHHSRPVRSKAEAIVMGTQIHNFDLLRPPHLKDAHSPASVLGEVKALQRSYNTFDPLDCPEHPRADYPKTYPVTNILENWQPDKVDPRPGKIYQTVCIFDYMTQRKQAQRYRVAEKPFIIRNIPDLDDTVLRWNDEKYVEEMLGNTKYKAEYSKDNHFMYWRAAGSSFLNSIGADKFLEPTEFLSMTFKEWYKKATSRLNSPDSPHWYFRVSGCSGNSPHGTRGGAKKSAMCPIPNFPQIFDEIPIFQPKESLFMVNPSEQRGVHCRFGMKGVIAENHFDGSRNMIALMTGERRYILSHPDQCENLALYPREHPSGRHSAVDWSDPDFVKFPQFKKAMVNEVVLQPGDVLYLPTSWFHYIISLNTNMQCNTRSGKTRQYDKFTKKCGF